MVEEFEECTLWSGKGTVAHKDGAVYEGEFKEGQLWNGKGVFTQKNGALYESDLSGRSHSGGRV